MLRRCSQVGPCILAVLLAACGSPNVSNGTSTPEPLPEEQEQETQSTTEGWHRAEGDGWSLLYPEDWESVGVPRGVEFRAAAMASSSEFVPNLTFAREPWNGDLESFRVASNEGLVRAGAQIVTQAPAQSEAGTGVDVEADWIRESAPSYHTVQRYLLHDGTGYVLACATSISEFAQYRELCRQILDTLRCE